MKSGYVRTMLVASVRKSRRETLYRMLAKRHAGHVPCFVCRQPVSPETATLEHKVPLSRGGNDDMSNLSISHGWCNHKRGADRHAA